MMRQIAIIALLISFLGCSDKDDNDDQSGCSGLACTEQFVTITVSVKDPVGDPVALDSFAVTTIDSGKDITREVNDSEFEMMKASGTYPLFGDEHRKTYEKTTVEVNFKGFDESDQEIVSAYFKVGADCCHVYLAEGETDIVID
ncbi:hypothetical protein OOZ15_07940 [Galbibacter sp. EGI 63066]|uniref:hypothetical protein n=1 Tax=Galbibacter sp. EGI 63066 TaxID=2993559 RepID=UPI00224912EA|nr:hypothetical protein [Galbibacter sp. EGI 63066]MCX2679862.1 hypothetical protein [Galbibacter sp. EGI 63066]